MTTSFCKMFGGEGAEEFNAMMTALQSCADDEEKSIYDWLDDTPKTSLVCFLVNKLHDLGYEIKKKKV